ncbi:MAG: FlgD immunoglobulin-like domain containing protein [Candidatus Neomarinimicrobiota bacterium]
MYAGSSGTGGVAIYPQTSNNTFIFNAGKTITFVDNANIGNGSSVSSLGTSDTVSVTFIVNGTMDLSQPNNTFNLLAAAGKTATLTVGSTGSIVIGGKLLTAVLGISDITVDGSLTVNGTAAFDNANNYIDGAGSFTLGNGATMNIGSPNGLDPVTGPIRTTTHTFSTAANYVFNGTVAQVTSVFLPATVNDLTINNAAGVTLGQATTVSGTLTLTNGNLDMSGYGLTWVNLIGTKGTVSQTQTLNAPTDVNIANLGAVITSGANLSSTVVKRGFTILMSGSSLGINRWFEITPTTNTGLNATLVLNYEESEIPLILDESELALFSSADTGKTWVNRGGTLDAVNNKITLTGIDAFSLWTIGAPGGVAGTYYVGAAGTAPGGADPLFPNLKAACDALNIAEVTGDVTMYITSDLTEPVNVALAMNTNGFSVTFKPYTGIAPTVTYTQNTDNAGTSGAWVIGTENTADAVAVPTHNIVIDGSNTVGGTTRDLTFVSASGANAYPFRIRGDCDYITIKNCTMTAGLSTIGYGIWINPVFTTENFNPDNISIENCSITALVHATGVGIQVAASGTTTEPMENLVVKNCDIFAHQRGVFLNGKTNITTIEGNTFEVPLSPTGYVGSAVIGNSIWSTGMTYILGNDFKVNTTVNTAAGNGIRTIVASGGGTFIIANNFFRGFAAPANASKAVEMIGIRCGSPVEAYYNTFVLNDIVADTGCLYRAINVAAGTPVIMNNIFVIEEDNIASYCIGGTPGVSDYNNFYLKGPTKARIHPTYATFAAWQAAGKDLNSVSKAVEFVSATDLHLAGASIGDFDLAGTPVPMIDTDIDGDMRAVAYPNLWPYMGADEAAVPLEPVYANFDLSLTFNDANDVTNWSHYDETNVYTVEAWDAGGALCLSDAGYDFLAKRPVAATPGWIYKLSMDIKTSLWAGAGNVLELSVQGFGNDDVKYSCIADTGWTKCTIMGIAHSDSGYIRIGGAKAGTVDTVFVDNVVWDDMYRNVYPSASIADARGVAIGDTLATVGVATATKHFGSAGPVYIQDGTAGIAVYYYAAAQSVALGDEILVIGKSKDYNGLLELDPTLDFIVLSKGHEVTPIEITAIDMDREAFEGQLVVIKSCDSLATGLGWPALGSNKGFSLKDKNDSTFYCYIDKDTDIDGSPIPTGWPLDFTGIVSDYKGAQLMPRSLADIKSSSKAPGAFTILNPPDETVITSFADPNLKKVLVGADSVMALYMKWTKAVDPDAGDVVTYQVMITPEGPKEDLITTDTVMYIPIDNVRPWDMNGSYKAYVVATDMFDVSTNSDTVNVTFNFPVPPEMTFTDIVLVGGVPKLYAMFNMPIEDAVVGNFTILDQSVETIAAPTAVDSIAPNAVMISGNLIEDHDIDLVYRGIVSPGGTVSVADTVCAGEVLIPFSANHPEDGAKVITNFETNVGSFLDPDYSGSTTGLYQNPPGVGPSVIVVSDSASYIGAKSGRLSLVDNPAITGGWYLRLLYGYPFAYTVRANSKLMFMVKGTNANVEIRLSVKDTGYEQGPWTRVSLSEDDWQVVSFDLLNDKAEGWVNGNGIIEGATVVIEGVHMRCSEDKDVVLYLDEFTERQVLTPVNVTFNVNMNKYVADGKFTLASDSLDVAGTFNSWNGTLMSDDNSDGIYSVVIPLMPYSTHNFKFRINRSWNDATCEFPSGGPNRVYTVGDSTDNVVNYWYNDQVLVGVDDEAMLPKVFALHQNYPNPFNPTTTIKYDLPKESYVKIVIYDIMGREVRTLINAKQPAGYQTVQWNAVNNQGNQISSGFYICVMQAGDFHKTQKMTILK